MTRVLFWRSVCRRVLHVSGKQLPERNSNRQQSIPSGVFMAPPRKNTLPKPLPDGFVLTDTERKKWRLGKIIGQGGFGLIYLASQDVDRPVAADTGFVIKLEYQENGPLFSELKFYQRAAKAEIVHKWLKSRKLEFLGIPTYWGSGLAEHKDLRYRFMAMDRLGSDLQKVCERNKGRLKKSTVLQLGRGLVDVLDYIHHNEYVHADIKAANLMLGYTNSDQVFLADYGLSYRFCPDGVHKDYKENPKKGHNGTIEYTSLDAHKGVAPSRRGDLQILGFCLLHWLCGSLPWDNVLKNPTRVQEAKSRLMDNLPESVQQLSARGAATDEVAAFLLYVRSLGYQQQPDYQHLKQLLAGGGSGKLDLSPPPGSEGDAATKEPDPPAGVKKAGRGRGSRGTKPAATKEEDDDDDDDEESKPKRVAARHRRDGGTKPVATKEEDDDDDEESKPKRVAARHRRDGGTTKPQPQQKKEEGVKRSLRPRSAQTYEEYESDDDEDDDEEELKPKPVAARYRRDPPITKPQPQKEEGVKRSLRPRSAQTYEEYESDDDEDEEEESRPQPIAACYLRRPPIGPRAQPKQNINSKRVAMVTEDWEDRSEHGPHRWKDTDLCYDSRRSFNECEASAAAAAQRTGLLLHWFLLVGVFLFLAAVVSLV